MCCSYYHRFCRFDHRHFIFSAKKHTHTATTTTATNAIQMHAFFVRFFSIERFIIPHFKLWDQMILQWDVRFYRCTESEIPPNAFRYGLRKSGNTVCLEAKLWHGWQVTIGASRVFTAKERYMKKKESRTLFSIECRSIKLLFKTWAMWTRKKSNFIATVPRAHISFSS